jgi:signal transduction histidine kinase
MSDNDGEMELRGVRDTRLAVHAVGPHPVWLWTPDGDRVLWANAAGAALLGAATCADARHADLNPADPLRLQVAQLAGRLAPNGTPRLERLRGFGGPFGRLVTFACARLVLDGGDVGILVAATEPIGKTLPRTERLRRLIDGITTPLAVFDADGELQCANAAAVPLLGAAASLAAMELDVVRADVLRDGRAEMLVEAGRIVLLRAGGGADTAIVAVITPTPVTLRTPAVEPTPEPAPEPAVDLAAEETAPASPTDEPAPGATPAATTPEASEVMAPVQEPSVQEMSAQETPVQKILVHESTAPETPVQETPAQGPPEQETPVPEAPALPPAAVDRGSAAEFARLADLPTTPRRHPLRFMWQMDAEGRFALGTDDFIRLIGPQTAAAMGRPWLEIAAQFALDPDGRVVRAIATRETWSGIVVNWPADDAGTRLPVELSGLPVFDSAQRFTGYRGFGVCRDLDALTQLAAHRRASLKYAPPMTGDAVAGATDAPVSPMPSPAMDTPAAPPPNVVPFPAATEAKSPGLSPVENHAFNELARTLAARLNAETIPAAPAVSAATTPPPTAASPSPPMRVSDASVQAAVLDRVPVGVLVYRLDHLLYANRAFFERTGYESLHALASAGGLDALFVETDSDAASTSENGTPLVLSTTRGNQVPVHARLYSVPWDGENALALIFGMAADSRPAGAVLPDTARLETELAAARRQAERATAARNDLLAKISHEIRAPLSAIIGFADVMIDERFGPLGNERYAAYLKDIRASGERVTAFINDLAELSRVETGKLTLTPTDIQLNELIEQCVALMQPQANRERIIIRTSLAPALATVKADAAALRQIVLSLISTSIRLAQAGGQVIVSSAAADPGEVALRVRDTGLSLSDAEIAAALEPFRISDETSVSGGVSLSLTKALAEANGGRFRIRPGAPAGTAHGGTLIEVLFPPA